MLRSLPLNLSVVARMEPLAVQTGRIWTQTRITPPAAPSGLRPTHLRNISYLISIRRGGFQTRPVMFKMRITGTVPS